MIVKETIRRGASEKLSRLNNKILAEKLDVPITRVRRWTKEFLPPDLVATRRSGYSRKFSLNEGFFIYWGGTIVHRYSITFDVARKIIDVIKPWALCNGHVPDIPEGAGRTGIDKNLNWLNFNVRTRASRVRKTIETFIEVEGIEGGSQYAQVDNSGRIVEGRSVTTQKYSIEPGFEGPQSFKDRSLPYWSLLSKFNKAVVYDYDGWIDKWLNLNKTEPNTKYEQISLNWLQRTEDIPFAMSRDFDVEDFFY